MKKAKETKTKNKYGAYKVSMTIVYENDDKDGVIISDEIWAAIKNSGIDVKLMNIDSIRQIANPEKAIGQILAGISGKTGRFHENRNHFRRQQFCLNRHLTEPNSFS